MACFSPTELSPFSFLVHAIGNGVDIATCVPMHALSQLGFAAVCGRSLSKVSGGRLSTRCNKSSSGSVFSTAKSLEREIPEWLETALTYLEEGKEGGIPFMDLEGLWRKSGNKIDVEELVKAWNDGGSSVTAGTSWKTVTSAIGSMLHQTPLFSDSLASTIAFMVSGKSGLNINPEKENNNRWTMLNTYLSDPEDISREKLSELKALMEHWHKVVEHEANNKMSYDVMATCASPLLFVGEMMGKKRTIVNGKPSFKVVPYLATMDAFATKGSVFVENVAFMIKNPARVGDPADVP